MATGGIPPIVLIHEQALQTFDKNCKSDISTNLNKLKKLMNNLKAEDVNLDPKFNDPEMWKSPLKAPCTFIEVFHNDIVSMNIFVLKPGLKIPMHDHPQMYGLLKVLSGKIRITSFSEYPVRENPSMFNYAQLLKHEGGRTTESFYGRRTIYAQIHQNCVCTTSSEPCVLTPTIANFHEIEALNEPAAFIDILSPPYDTPPYNDTHQGIWVRRCKYYYIAHDITTVVVELKEKTKPDWFYSDQAHYVGPRLSGLGPTFNTDLKTLMRHLLDKT